MTLVTGEDGVGEERVQVGGWLGLVREIGGRDFSITEAPQTVFFLTIFLVKLFCQMGLFSFSFSPTNPANANSQALTMEM